MLMLDHIREEFARHLSEDPTGRWRMDAKNEPQENNND